MFQLLTSASVAWVLSSALICHTGDDPFSPRVSQEEFEKKIQPLLAGIKKSEPFRLYEGLPHQRFEAELLKKELETKETIKFLDYPFYKEAIPLKRTDSKRLSEIFADI